MPDTTRLRDGKPARVLEEYDTVTTLEDVLNIDDQVVPAGSVGVIVDVSPVAGGCFVVEFDQPIQSVATVTRAQLA